MTTSARVAAEADQRLGDRLLVVAVGDAEQLPAGAGGVGQRAEEVEDRAHAPAPCGPGTTWAIAAWWRGANMKPKPTSSMQRPTCSGSSSMLTPRASSRSAEPHLLVLERLPCLATAQPAAGGDQRRRGRDVEGRGAAAGAGGVDQVRAAAGRPAPPASASSAPGRPARARSPPWPAARSGRRRSAPRSARPSMISASTAEAWSAVRWSPAQTASIARVTMSLGIGSASPRKFRSRCFPCGVSTDSGWNWTPSAGSSRWRAPITTSPQGGAHLELVREVGVGDQRVVAAGDQRARQRRRRSSCRRARPRRPCRGPARPGRRGRRRPRPAPGGRGRRRAPACRPRRRRGPPRPRSRPRPACRARARRRAGRAPRSSSSPTSALSLRTTSTSAPSSPRYWTRL